MKRIGTLLVVFSSVYTIAFAQVDYDSEIQPIFNASCALSNCHVQGSQVFSMVPMDLSSGNSYAALVNVRSVQDSLLLRVKPSDPDSSYLYIKLTSTGTTGQQMPLAGPPLDSSLIAKVRQWIEEGASFGYRN
jgi:hypothetical protein